MKPSIASRAGRWSARHRRTAILGWLAFVILATVVGGSVGQENVPDSEQGNGESKRGDMIVAAAGYPETVTEQVLIQGREGQDARAPELVAAAGDLSAALGQTEGVSGVREPVASADGRSLLVTFELPDADDQGAPAGPALATVAAVQARHPGVRVEEFGDASVVKALTEADEQTQARSELFSYSATLVILLIAFGAIVAAGVPLLLGATAVAGSIGLLGPLSQIQPLSEQVSVIVTLIGLAVGVDYAMFYSRRVLEERDRGNDPEQSVVIAAATSGRAVLISGFTVMVAMGGMLIAGNPIFTAFGIGTILVVGVAVLGSLSFLPAMLTFLLRKNWLEKGRVPWIAKRRHAHGGKSRVWGAVLDRVLRRPLVAALSATAVLVALAVPALGMQFKDPGTEGFSRSLPIIQTYDRLQEAFPGGALPAVVVVRADDVTSPAAEQAIAQLRERALDSGQLKEPVRVEVSPDRTVAQVLLSLPGTGTDTASERAVTTLRDDVVPATVGRLEGAEVAVTGIAAQSKDFLDVMTGRLPLVFAFVLGLAFVLLLVTFRSIVVPIKAIVLNLLSVGAAYGILVLVFQNGHGEGLLDFQSVGGITSWLPLFLFVILFGLSMDYHVFILSRVREAVDRGADTEAAVADAIKSTAGVVTSAAAVMVAVFASFAISSDQTTKQLAVGLAAAILIDATIVRAVLLPATMKLLGNRNWYLPSRLSWLPSPAPEAPVPSASA